MTQEKYFDMHGREITEGLWIKHVDEKEPKLVYKTIDGDLGLNASNENFIGFNELERELYPLYQFSLKREWEIVPAPIVIENR